MSRKKLCPVHRLYCDGGRVAHICPIKLGGPHLASEMWETMNPNLPLFVLSNSGF